MDTLHMIEHQLHCVREVPRISALGYGPIEDDEAWEDSQEFKELTDFLKRHRVHVGLAKKIYLRYGFRSLSVVKADPYRLPLDVAGIGFKTADRIAHGLGLPLDAPSRLEAGIVYALQQSSRDGHVYAPQPYLVELSTQLLEVTQDLLISALARLEGKGKIRRERLPDQPEPAVYLTSLYQAETNVVTGLRRMVNSAGSRLNDMGIADWDMLSECPVRLSPDQLQAVQTALSSKVCILTGKPGTGKTTTLCALIHLLEAHRHRHALSSPTGRAAKRLKEVTGREARTIHRLLGFSPDFGFAFNAYHRLDIDMVVVDEASMLDLPLMSHLLQALDPATHLLLVGDADQLPSVGPGNILSDLITCGQIPVVQLTTIFRQAADSLIVTNAHRIHQGQMPVFGKGEDDFFLFERSDPGSAAEWVVDIVQNRIPRKFGLDPLEDVQVLTPMRKGTVGVDNLNRLLQAALNPPLPDKPEQKIGERVFRMGDRVMQIRNDYAKQVVNGDIGLVVEVDDEEETLTVAFDRGDHFVRYLWGEADDLRHAFAASIHKAQGSEFPAVVVPVLKQHRRMLKRNLLYTAITRAQKLCVLVGTRQAIRMAVENVSAVKRWSGLASRLGN